MTNATGTPIVARIAERRLVAIDAAATVEDAARTMAQRRIGSVAVREDGELVGLVTERDLLIAVLVRGKDARLPLREAMRREVPRVPATASVETCAALMRDHATRHLLVEEAGRVLGVVSMRDIVRSTLAEKQFLIEQLGAYIDGYGAPTDRAAAAL